VKRDFIFSGILGLIAGMLIWLGANWVKSFVPTLLPGFLFAIVTFVILLFTALLEMPVMVFAFRKMAQPGTMSRKIITVGFSFYVLFAAVYAVIFMLLADADYIYLGAILAVLGIVRFFSGIFIQ